jgi:hypothetical protein
MITSLVGDHINNTEMSKTPINFFLSRHLDTGPIMTWTNTLIRDKENKLESCQKESRNSFNPKLSQNSRDQEV